MCKLLYHHIDPYKGYDNHLIYDSRSGYLPELDRIEADLRSCTATAAGL